MRRSWCRGGGPRRRGRCGRPRGSAARRPRRAGGRGRAGAARPRGRRRGRRPRRTGSPDVRRVGDHDRDLPLERGRDARMVLRQRVDEAGVDDRAAHRLRGPRAAAERRGEQRQRDPRLLGLDRQAAQGGDGGRVAERVGQPLGEQHADRAGAAGAQGAPGRVGPRVAELAASASTRSRRAGLSWSGRLNAFDAVVRETPSASARVGGSLARRSRGARLLAALPAHRGGGQRGAASEFWLVMSNSARAVMTMGEPFWID